MDYTTGTGRITVGASDGVTIYNGGTGARSALLTLDASGNLGIGTSSPGFRFDVQSTGSTTAQFYRTDGIYSITLKGTGTTATGALGMATNDMVFLTNGSERMRLDSSGNLGIGVTSPSARLHVVSSAAIASKFDSSASGGPLCGYYSSGAIVGYIGSSGSWLGTSASDFALAAESGKALTFFSGGNSTERARIDSSGNLLVGTTSVPTGSTGGAGFEAASNSRKILRLATTVTTANNLAEFYNPNGIVGAISTSGSATTYSTSSDQRLKTNVEPAGSAIQSILDFPVDQFDWISDGSHQDFGAVAQKVQPIIPEMVSVPADEDEMWGIDWSKAVPRLIKTIQELSAELNELKTKVNA